MDNFSIVFIVYSMPTPDPSFVGTIVNSYRSVGTSGLSTNSKSNEFNGLPSFQSLVFDR